MFLTTEEAALELRVTSDTVREWAALGKLPGNKMGRLWRFEKNKIEAFARGEWASTNERPAPSIEGLHPSIWNQFPNFPQIKLPSLERLVVKRKPGSFYTRLRKAAILRRTPKWADEDAILAIYVECAEITRTTNVMHHVDHIVPLVGKTVCGLHVA